MNKTALLDRFVPWDIEVARYNFGANCGPVAFAVALKAEVCDVMRFFPQFAQNRRWTNSVQMREALEAVSVQACMNRCSFPEYGLALIQWLGPWTRANFFSPPSLRYTHWIAVDGDWVFDHNASDWMTKGEWETDVAADLLSAVPQAAGWAVKYGIEICKSNVSCPSHSIVGRGRSVSEAAASFCG